MTSEIRICPSCSAPNRPSAKFCRFCGGELAAMLAENPLSVQSSPEKTLPAVPDSVSFSSDYISLLEIRGRLSMFINTLSIRQRQKKIGMAVMNSNNILVFSGETGTG